MTAIGANSRGIVSCSTASASASVRRYVLIANPALLNDLGVRIGENVARVIDSFILNWTVSSNFFIPANGVLGGPGVTLTPSALDTAIANVGAVSTFGEPMTYIANVTGTLQNGASFPNMLTGWYKRVRIVVSPDTRVQGNSPVLQWSFLSIPSALVFVSSELTLTNDATNAQALSEIPGLAIRIAIANTGSGNQTISAQVEGVAIGLSAAKGQLILN